MYRARRDGRAAAQRKGAVVAFIDQFGAGEGDIRAVFTASQVVAVIGEPASMA
jgi:hypothetical protein